MQSEISKADAPLVSRRERAALSPAESNRQAFGFYCTEILRLNCLSPTQHLVAWLLGFRTLKQGFNSVDYSTLEELTDLGDGSGPFAGLGANDLSPALRHLRGLGIVHIDPKSNVEAAMPLWTLLVIADSGQWSGVPANGWRWAADGLARLKAQSCRQRHTGALHGLAREADLHDGRAAVMPMVHRVAADAPLAENGKITATNGRRYFSANADAPDVPPKAGRDAVASRHSESRNADLRGNARAIPKVGMRADIRARARCNWNLEIGIENLQLQVASDASRDELEKIKVALNEGDERRFIAAARLVIGARDWDDGRTERHQGDGGKWRNRFNHAPSKSLVIAVMLDCVEQRNFSGSAAQDLWKRWGGKALDAARFAAAPKNSRNLLITQ
jgi:hypothetical protein